MKSRARLSLFILVAIGVPLMLLQCSSVAPDASTQGEQWSGYTYIPLDPLPVVARSGPGCSDYSCEGCIPSRLLQYLPDNYVRMLVQQQTANGSVSYGPAKIGTHNELYKITVDYITVDTVSVPLWFWRTALTKADLSTYYLDFGESPESHTDLVQGSATWSVSWANPFPGKEYPSVRLLNVPVYVGVGLRVIANVQVTGATANISGLGVLGAEAEASNLKGSLVIQTLGVNGKAIAAALPIQSELNRTTAQNAVVAVASIKTLLYSDDTLTAPRVVGLYLPGPGDASLVNGVVTALYGRVLEWYRFCPAQTVTGGVVPPPTVAARLTIVEGGSTGAVTPTATPSIRARGTATPVLTPRATPRRAERPTPFVPTQPPPLLPDRSPTPPRS